MKKFISIFFLAIAFSASSQGFKERIYAGYVSGEMNDWYLAMEEMESIWKRTGSYDMLYELVVAQYGYIAYCISVEEDKIARQFVAKAEDNLELILEKTPGMARAHALLGAVYGFKVGLNPYKAVVFGTRAFSENKLAFELDPLDPVVWMEKGHIEFYKPAIFGSSSIEAAKMYRRAVELYEKNPEELRYNWLYINTLRSLADAYIDAGSYDKANAVYLKVLAFEPGLKWMHEEVYPAFKKKYGF
jgi:tetratricopeptide (TPR) repeat protein